MARRTKDTAILWKVGSANPTLTGSTYNTVRCESSARITAERHVIYTDSGPLGNSKPQKGRAAGRGSDSASMADMCCLPAYLTHDSSLHPGVEVLDLVFQAPAGRYVFNLHTVENHVRRVRKGSNLEWDGDVAASHEAGKSVRFTVPDSIVRRYIKEVESQIESETLDRTTIDFWLLDEIANRPHNNLYTITLDGREIGAFCEHWPRFKLSGPDEFRVRHIPVSLLIDTAGLHTISIRPHMIRNHRFYDAVWQRFASRRMIIAGADLQQSTPKGRVRTSKTLKAQTPASWTPFNTHPLRNGVSREYPTGFYGWMLPIFYQRYDQAGASLDYMRNVMKEAMYRGSNFTSIYLTDCNSSGRKGFAGGYAGVTPWPDEMNIPGKEDYNYNPDSGWTADHFEQLIEASHESGMLTSWFTHLPHLPDHVFSLNWPWMRSYTQVVLQQFASLNKPPHQRINGLLYETAGFANDVDMMLLHNEYGRQNPLLFFGESEGKRERTTAGLTPSRIEYHATTDHAWEDKFCDVSYFDNRWHESEYGACCYFGQMNCRDRKYTVLYGEMGPDAIVKQVSDVVRRYAIESKLPGKLTGCEWILESPETMTARNREMVYAASGDPVYGALAFEADTYGTGGRMDQSARRLTDRFFCRSRLADDIPHTATMLQNNYMQLSIWPGNDGGLLLLDDSALAHFDSDGMGMHVSEGFVSTNIVGSTLVHSNEALIVRRGPYLAEVQESLHLATNEPVIPNQADTAEISETRRYAMIADMPMLHVEIQRTLTEQEPETYTHLPLAGYDKLRVGSKWYGPDNRPETFDMADVMTQSPAASPGTAITARPADAFRVACARGSDCRVHPSESKVPAQGKAPDRCAKQKSGYTALVVRDSRGLLPDLCVVVHKDTAAGRSPDRIRWRSNDGIGLWWDNPKTHKYGVGSIDVHPVITGSQAVQVDIFVLGDLYRLEDVPHLHEVWKAATRTRLSSMKTRAGTVAKRVKHSCKVPVVAVARMPVGQRLPFWVNENNRWHFRAAQPDGDHDLVKCYLTAGSSSVVQRYGFVHDAVQPSPGCQYSVLLDDVRARKQDCEVSCTVRHVSAAITPALQFAEIIRKATVDGKPWCYFDHNQLYLPKTEGTCDVRVWFGADGPGTLARGVHRPCRADTPLLIGTQAHVASAVFENNTMTLDMKLCHYTHKLPPAVYHFAAIRYNSRKVVKVSGADIAAQHDDVVVLQFKSGKIRVTFSD